MTENNKDSKRSITKKQYIVSIIVTLIIGVAGTLFIVERSTNTTNNNGNQAVEETTDLNLDTPSDFDLNYDELRVIDKLYAILMTTYFEEIDSNILIEGALEGMASAIGDPYTEYLDEIESTSFDEDISGSFQGIGAEVMKDGEYVRIVSPIANSPAAEAGLQPNDLIIEVDGESVADLTINEAVSLIRGPEGTDVELLLIRGDEQFSMTLTRAQIPVETVFYEVDKENPEVGYVNIVNFNLPTYLETVDAIKALQELNVQKIIFDVRGNPGGLLTSAIEISNIFVPNGEPIMMTEYRQDEEPTVYMASDDYGAFKYEGEAVLLVNEGSASASEILAGAMQSIGIPIYGQTTFGKGTVQSLVDLGATDELKFTSGKWLTAEGEWINESGITPDVPVELPAYAQLFIVNPMATYKKGDNSAEVKNLKSVLIALGYNVTDNDSFDESVVVAVEEFQVANDLTADGIVTGNTSRALTDQLRTKIDNNDTQYEAALEYLIK